MPQINGAEIDKRFDYVPPNDTRSVLHGRTRAAYKELAVALGDVLPESREKSLAITALEESLMWANAAIARNIGEPE